MNLKRIVTIAYKEWREILRDKLFFFSGFYRIDSIDGSIRLRSLIGCRKYPLCCC